MHNILSDNDNTNANDDDDDDDAVAADDANFCLTWSNVNSRQTMTAQCLELLAMIQGNLSHL